MLDLIILSGQSRLSGFRKLLRPSSLVQLMPLEPALAESYAFSMLACSFLYNRPLPYQGSIRAWKVVWKMIGQTAKQMLVPFFALLGGVMPWSGSCQWRWFYGLHRLVHVAGHVTTGPFWDSFASSMRPSVPSSGSATISNLIFGGVQRSIHQPRQVSMAQVFSAMQGQLVAQNAHDLCPTISHQALNHFQVARARRLYHAKTAVPMFICRSFTALGWFFTLIS